MKTPAQTPLVPKVRPSDVSDGATVRRRFVPKVLGIIETTATAASSYIEGTMVHSSVGYKWTLPKGRALQTPPFWGRPSVLLVEDEDARADILKALGVDLSRSPVCRRCR